MHRLFLFTALLLAACQQADSFDEDLAPPTDDEPITGQPVTPNPGDAAPVKDPFKPYGIGPPEHAIPKEQLSAAERALVERSQNLPAESLEAYRQAVLQRSRGITGEVAGHHIGLSNLDVIGVVP